MTQLPRDVFTQDKSGSSPSPEHLRQLRLLDAAISLP
jgi:hypothetical protein